jgi:glucose/arabinose dehydrogenase
LHDLEVILSVVPSKDTLHHFGGRMTFLADGTLLVTSGDGLDYREQALDLSSLLGKTLRINSDGSIPSDNPFVATPNARPEVWTYGHRNQQGIVTTPQGVYLHEHGPRGGDELNFIKPANNYGWPAITYGIDYSGSYISPFTKHPGMQQPVVYWVPSIAPAGMAYYDGDAFPKWHGDLFVAALVEESVRRVDLEDGLVVDQEILFTELGERLRDVRVGPDGNLYLLTDSAPGKVMRVKPRN